MIRILNKFFVNIHSLDGLIHWSVQRFTAISVLICLFFVFFFDSQNVI